MLACVRVNIACTASLQMTDMGGEGKEGEEVRGEEWASVPTDDGCCVREVWCQPFLFLVSSLDLSHSVLPPMNRQTFIGRREEEEGRGNQSRRRG